MVPNIQRSLGAFTTPLGAVIQQPLAFGRRIRTRWQRIYVTGQLGPVGDSDAVRGGRVRF